MRTGILIIICVSFLLARTGPVLAQADWEFLGPDVGYVPEALFVSERAMYLGLSEEDETGLGLYRYVFSQEAWEPFAWEGYRITGVVVWGEEDENICLIRVEPVYSHSAVMRSTDGGDTWAVTDELSGEALGLTQAPSDTARLIMHFPDSYSSDGGWTWHNPGGGPWDVASAVSFEPTNALNVYMQGINEFSIGVIYKSINGGQNWGTAYWPDHTSWGIEVEQYQPNHVMGGTLAPYTIRTTDAGETWTEPDAPFRTKPLVSPPWLPRTIFVAGTDLGETTYEVWRTDDLGDTWSPCGDSLPDYPGGSLRWTEVHLEAHPSEPILFAALEGSGVWRWDGAAATVPEAAEVPDYRYRLHVYPNPATEALTYSVDLPVTERVALRLFDVRGRLIQTLRNGVFEPGSHTFSLSRANLDRSLATEGIYYMKLETGTTQLSQKIVLLR